MSLEPGDDGNGNSPFEYQCMAAFQLPSVSIPSIANWSRSILFEAAMFEPGT